MQSLRFFFLIALLYCSSPAQAQPFKNTIPQLMLTQWTGDQGLISNNLTSSIQSQSGFIWITTYNGLMRFDGIKFDIYHKQITPSLPSDSFYRTYEDSTGVLWFASQSNGITRYYNNRFEHFLPNDSILPKSIRCLFLESNTVVWAGSSNRGLFRIENGQVSPVADSILKDISVLDILKDKQGTIWVATEGYGVISISKQGIKEFTTFEGLASNIVNTLALLPTGEIAAGTNNGLNFINHNTISVQEQLKGIRINKLEIDLDGTVWIGAETGLGRLSKDKNYFEFSDKNNYLPFSRINDLTVDDEGNLWISTGRNGLLRLRETPITPLTTAQGLSSDLSNCVIEGKNNDLYFGSDLGFLDHYVDGHVYPIPIKTQLNQESIRDIHLAENGDLWIATYKGVLHISDSHEKLYTENDGLPTTDVRRILADSRGNLWFATRSSGIVKFNEGKVTDVVDRAKGLSSNYILAVEEDAQQRIFLGTHSGGLNIIEPDGSIKIYHFSKQDDGMLIFNMHFDNNGETWMATNNGLFHFKDGQFTEIVIKQTAPGKTYFDCFRDGEGYLWLTSNNGLLRLHPEEISLFLRGSRTDVTPRIFNEEDGMLTRECSSASRALVGSNGLIYVPTISGVSIINTSQILDQQQTPSVIITGLQTDDQFFPLDAAIQLAPGNLRYTFVFTAPVFTSPTRVQFKYKLEGVDRFWVNAKTDRQVEYTNLPPGTYTFRVIAAIGDGPWSTQSSSATITIQPYFYQTVWFQTVIVGVIVLLLVVFYKWRVRFIVKRNEELIKVNTELDRFVYSASHDLRAPLTSILGLVTLARMDKETPTDSYLKRIEISIHKMDAFIRDIIDFSRNARVEITTEVIDFQKLIEDVVDNLKYLNEGNQIERTITVNGTEPFRTDRKRLAIILNNLISNAFKYYNPENEKPFIIIQVHHTKSHCSITIADNGIGIPAAHLGHIFKMFYRAHEESKGSGLGLYIVKETIDKLNGKIQVQSTVGKGTTFEIQLPNLKPGKSKKPARQ